MVEARRSGHLSRHDGDVQGSIYGMCVLSLYERLRRVALHEMCDDALKCRMSWLIVSDDEERWWST